MRKMLIEQIKQSLMEHIGKSCMLAENIADDIIANGEIVPPCEVGDKVYDISEFFDGTNCPEIYEYDVSYIRIEKEKGKQIFYIADLKYPTDEWGKTLFFNKEEALAMLTGGSE